jgi:hypothetical protein
MIRSSISPLLALCMLTGCSDPKSSLGELPLEATGTETSDDTVTADDSGSISMTGMTGGQSSEEIGLACQLSAVPETYWLELDNASCASGMCLYADTTAAYPQRTCTGDAECTSLGQGVICGATGWCELDPAHVAARSRCTDTCEDDAECVGADGTTCAGGFACVPVSSLGAVCCQRVCVCRDELDVYETSHLAESCEAGLTPGCCDQEPLPEACGG